MPLVTRTPVRAIAADISRVSRRITAAGQLGLTNSCVSCRSRSLRSRATVSMRSAGSAKRFTSGLVLSDSVSPIAQAAALSSASNQAAKAARSSAVMCSSCFVRRCSTSSGVCAHSFSTR